MNKTNTFKIAYFAVAAVILFLLLIFTSLYSKLIGNLLGIATILLALAYDLYTRYTREGKESLQQACLELSVTGAFFFLASMAITWFSQKNISLFSIENIVTSLNSAVIFTIFCYGLKQFNKSRKKHTQAK